jgi:hypothetical protein
VLLAFFYCLLVFRVCAAVGLILYSIYKIDVKNNLLSIL